jgi:hypothetical protein
MLLNFHDRTPKRTARSLLLESHKKTGNIDSQPRMPASTIVDCWQLFWRLF